MHSETHQCNLYKMKIYNLAKTQLYSLIWVKIAHISSTK